MHRTWSPESFDLLCFSHHGHLHEQYPKVNKFQLILLWWFIMIDLEFFCTSIMFIVTWEKIIFI
jgi:hypothetical protein